MLRSSWSAKVLSIVAATVVCTSCAMLRPARGPAVCKLDYKPLVGESGTTFGYIGPSLVSFTSAGQNARRHAASVLETAALRHARVRRAGSSPVRVRAGRIDGDGFRLRLAACRRQPQPGSERRAPDSSHVEFRRFPTGFRVCRDHGRLRRGPPAVSYKNLLIRFDRAHVHLHGRIHGRESLVRGEHL